MKSSHQIFKRLVSFQILFLILVVLNTVPILMFNCYPSLDGPAHLYNVNVLKQLLIQKNQFLGQYFTLNREVIPNWTSHFILLVFRLIFSSATANKLLLLIIAVSLPISVYSLINRIAPRNIMLSVFALPFVYTYLFGLGFYNFCIGVILFIITLNYWLRPGKRISMIRILGLFGLLTISYFTHILIFLVTFLSIGLFSLLNLLGDLRERKTGPETYKELFFVFLAGLPGLFLTYQYVAIRNPPIVNSRVHIHELVKWIVDVRSLIIHNYSTEVKYSRFIFFVAAGLLLYVLIRKFPLSKLRSATRRLNGTQFYFGILSLVLLILYFVFPNSSSGGSYITVRMNILFYMVLMIWLCTFRYPKLLIGTAFIVMLASGIGLSYKNYVGLCSYRNLMENYLEAEKRITGNSVVLSIWNSDWMLDTHFPHLLGWNKPVVILDNFEATVGYYPLVWNHDKMPSLLLADSLVSNVCLYTRFPNSSPVGKQIDYVVVWGNTEMSDCKANLFRYVEKEYSLVYSAENPDLLLYQLNTEPR